jgi:hypothetical protein
VAAASLLCLPLAVRGQVETQTPVTNSMPSNDFGFNLPTQFGTLSYSLSGSEFLETGQVGSVESNTALSGNLAFISKSESDPFSAVYSGGYIYRASSGSSGSYTFQDLAVSQVYRTKSWVFVVSDAFSFLPGAPTTGLSGVAGVGDVGVTPVQTGLGPTQDILTNESNRISNGLNGSATWQVTPDVDLEGSASWDILHFTESDNPGISSHDYMGTFGPKFRIDARDSVGAEAYYSRSTYPTYSGYLIESMGANVSFDRDWSRRLSTSISLGPESSHGRSTEPIPAQLTLGARASAKYATRTTGLYADYTRGVTSGSGVIFAAISDDVQVGMTRPLSRDWSLAADVAYRHNVGLAADQGIIPRYDTVLAAMQVSHRLTESLSAYASETILHQTSNHAYGVNALEGFNNIVGFGITFSPAPLVRAQ